MASGKAPCACIRCQLHCKYIVLMFLSAEMKEISTTSHPVKSHQLTTAQMKSLAPKQRISPRKYSCSVQESVAYQHTCTRLLMSGFKGQVRRFAWATPISIPRSALFYGSTHDSRHDPWRFPQSLDSRTIFLVRKDAIGRRLPRRAVPEGCRIGLIFTRRLNTETVGQRQACVLFR